MKLNQRVDGLRNLFNELKKGQQIFLILNNNFVESDIYKVVLLCKCFNIFLLFKLQAFH